MNVTQLSYNEPPGKIVQVISLGKSLTLIVNPSGDYALSAGTTFELRVTVVNQGNLGAIIDVYIDETSTSVWDWCLNPRERLALSPQQSAEVVFECPVPPQTIPGTYHYSLVVDAPQHYPEDTPIHHAANLQVLPLVQSAVRTDDPTFSLVPTSTATEPTIIQPGRPLTVRAIVNNRDRRVDRFRLSCTDIPSDWIEIEYPEGINDLGLVVATESLALNPGAVGEISLRLNLPSNVQAGRYASTLQLISENRPELALLDILHFNVPATYDLGLNLRTIVGRIRRGSGKFELYIHNRGNTARELRFEAREEGEIQHCIYTFTPEEFRIRQDESKQIAIEVQPRRWWHRPWWGRGRVFEFYLEPQDLYQLPLPQERVNGTLIWEARPWWQLLLAILAGLGAIAALILAILWVFFKPPAPPRILEFTSESPRYAAANDDFIHLGWIIDNPRQIRTLEVVGKSPDGRISSQAVTYDFSRGVPNELQSLCTLKRLLQCHNIRTDARQPGDYIFELRLLPKRSEQSIQSAKTSLINIQPLPIPKITNFAAKLRTQTLQSEKSNPLAQQIRSIAQLNFQVLHGDRIQTLKLVSRSPDGTINFEEKGYNLSSEGLSPELLGACEIDWDGILTCQGLSLDLEKPDTYIFEVQVISPESQGEVADSRQADPIVLAAPEPPQVTEFASDRSTYQMGEQQRIQFQWVIDNVAQLQQLELRSVSTEGLVNVPPITYRFDEQLPEALQDRCQITEEQLVCRNIAIALPEPGRYNFELTAIPRSEYIETEPSQKTYAVQIEPPELPEVGRLAAAQLNYQVGENTPIRLNWRVENPQQLREIRLVGRSPEGIVRVPEIIYPFNGQVPSVLEKNCLLTPETLVCKNVPTSAQEAGDYIFELKAIHRGTSDPGSSSFQSDRIRIQPRPVTPPPTVAPPQIEVFQINGQDAPAKYIIEVESDTSPTPLNFSWEVSGEGTLKTELLPVPGAVANTGNITYPIAPQSGQETLTLRVTNTEGKQVQRSILIETVVLPKVESTPTRPEDSETPDVTPSPSIPLAPSPEVELDPLEPLDNPPQFD